MKTVFFCDIDDTLTFSVKKAHPEDICVEYIDGKEQGFMTPSTVKAYKKLMETDILFVPVTTRSIEQYKRINWLGTMPEYAVTSNGGNLLINGIEDERWKRRSTSMVRREDLENIVEHCRERHPTYRTKIVDELFVVMVRDHASEDVNIDESLFSSFNVTDVGRKTYVIPKGLDKGTGIKWFQEEFPASRTISAGDGIMDVPMFDVTDIAILPSADMIKPNGRTRYVEKTNDIPFPEFVLNTVLSETIEG